MYSVVLMAALTAGGSTPTWGFGCHGGLGGCHGGFGFFRGGCHGGYGGCNGYGRGCYGGYGGCYSTYGGACSGGAGYTCYASGGYGYVGGGCHGGYGGCHGGAAMPAYGPGAVPARPSAAPPGAPAPEPVPPPKKEDKSASLNQARLIVELPADAKLYVDDRLMKTTSERRLFNSPQLEQGQTYYYILRAEVVRNGQTLSETKRVFLHAGDVIQASFRDLEATEASGGR